MSRYVSVAEPIYPKRLKEIDTAPKKLYYKGKFREELFENCLAVVGSRRVTPYGKRAAEDLVFEIASRGITVVSGFMYGVDMIAHQTTLAAEGQTAAVVAYGIKRACPKYTERTYQRILKSSGVVLSEYGEDEPARKFMFPKRNRIIAGLCQAVLVVEAGLKSGSLITAKYALKYKRKLFAVPGSIYNHNSKGTNMLIKTGKAAAVLEASDILKFYDQTGDRNTVRESFKQGGENPVQKSILDLISKQPLTRDELCQTAKIPVSRLNQELTLLSLSGRITEIGGKYSVNHR